MEDLKNSTFNRILVVKLSAMGDNIMATPVARGLRDLYPNAVIDWLVEPLSADILRGNPFLDNVLVWDRKHSRNVPGLRGLIAFRRDLGELRQRIHGHYDLALDLQGLARSALAMAASGAPVRVGETERRECSDRFLTHKWKIEDRNRRTAAQYADILRIFGHPNPPMTMEIFPSDENRAQADNLLGGAELSQGGIVSIAAATTRPYKHWTDAAFADTLDKLDEKFGLRGVIHGGPADQAMGQRITALCRRAKPLIIAGQTTLRDACEVIRRSRLFVGVDTGLSHAAIAMKTPTIFIYGPNNPARLLHEPGVAVLQRVAPRERSRLASRRSWWDDRSIDQNTPDDVLAAATQLLRSVSRETAAP
ncbi:MAG TPA: glycosyltransferase family 9 protein [Armatimonadota bacterium]|jgi:heptosyltransferase-1